MIWTWHKCDKMKLNVVNEISNRVAGEESRTYSSQQLVETKPEQKGEWIFDFHHSGAQRRDYKGMHMLLCIVYAGNYLLIL